MATDMETEEEILSSDKPCPSSSPSSSSSLYPNRLAVRKTIQTNFGEDYVFQIALSPRENEVSTLAVSLSSNVIKLYSPETGQYVGECKGHSNTINEISFSMPSFLCSCSSDGTVRAWDTRASFRQVSLFQTHNREIFSFCLGGSSKNLLSAGCNAQILLWDLRNMKMMASLEELHIDDVTQVRFVPNQQNVLISSSVDGLLCIYDTEGTIGDDDENLETVMNVGTSIGKIGFFGESDQKLWCLTHIETLSVWNWRDGRSAVNFEDARSLASDAWNLDQVDYFVDCFHDEVEDRLWVIGGTNGGTLGYFPMCCEGSGAIGSVDAILEGGHAGLVRSVLPAPITATGRHGSITGDDGVFAWSGGEDGRLCCWLSKEMSSEAKHSSWISSTLAMRSPKALKKCRRQPY